MILWMLALAGDKVTYLLAVTFHDLIKNNWFQSGTLFAVLQTKFINCATSYITTKSQ